MWIDYCTRDLRDHASAQCCVRLYENGDICLQSYMTDVVYYDSTRGMLYCTGTYSQTTRKHISWFLREYFPLVTYHDMRTAYDDGFKLSEVLDWRFIPLTQKEKNIMYSAHHGTKLSPNFFREVI